MLPLSFLFNVVRPRRPLWIVALVLGLSACTSMVTPQIQRLPDRVELNSVPFFRGNAYQSGPGALASMLSNHQVAITPGLLDKSLRLPGGEDQLERTMPDVARQYGFMVYPLDNRLDALLAQVSAGYPVMLRVSEGSAWWKGPRYGVLVGYNRIKQTVLLQMGMGRRQMMSFSSFVSAWEDAGSWAVLIQGPRQLPANVDQQRWMTAANELSRAGQEQAAGEAVKALARQGVK